MKIPESTFTDWDVVALGKALKYVFADADGVNINFENRG